MRIKSIIIAAAAVVLMGAAAWAQDQTKVQVQTTGQPQTTTTTTTTTTQDQGAAPATMSQDQGTSDEGLTTKGIFCWAPMGEELFHANEWSLDAFGTYLNPMRGIKSFPNTNIRNGTWGGGVGANYFWSKDVGLGADTSFQDGGIKFVNHVGGNLIVRFPFDCWRLVPYIFGGGGYQWSDRGQWFVDLGAGLEFRFNRHLGLFGDARYMFGDKVQPTIPPSRDNALFRTGLRFAF
jgi:Outer membrane protein beta-barrel domain